jgi:cupin 2 domain-containing protein
MILLFRHLSSRNKPPTASVLVLRMMKTGNLRRDYRCSSSPGRAFTTLVDRPGLRIDRIVSTGQTTPEGQWHDQETDEWVLLMEGAARLRVDRTLTEGEGESERWILLPAHCRHRVTWTRASRRRSGSPCILFLTNKHCCGRITPHPFRHATWAKWIGASTASRARKKGLLRSEPHILAVRHRAASPQLLQRGDQRGHLRVSMHR